MLRITAKPFTVTGKRITSREKAFRIAQYLQAQQSSRGALKTESRSSADGQVWIRAAVDSAGRSPTLNTMGDGFHRSVGVCVGQGAFDRCELMVGRWQRSSRWSWLRSSTVPVQQMM